MNIAKWKCRKASSDKDFIIVFPETENNSMMDEFWLGNNNEMFCKTNNFIVKDSEYDSTCLDLYINKNNINDEILEKLELLDKEIISFIKENFEMFIPNDKKNKLTREEKKICVDDIIENEGSIVFSKIDDSENQYFRIIVNKSDKIGNICFGSKYSELRQVRTRLFRILKYNSRIYTRKCDSKSISGNNNNLYARGYLNILFQGNMKISFTATDLFIVCQENQDQDKFITKKRRNIPPIPRDEEFMNKRQKR